MEREYLKKEIADKLANLHYASIDLANGGHVSSLHVGLTDQEMLRRQKSEGTKFVSSFDNKVIFNACIYKFVEDNLEFIVRWLLNPASEPRFVEEYFLDEKVGKVVLPNGGIVSTECFRVVLVKNDKRDGAAQMPFNVVTMYPVV